MAIPSGFKLVTTPRDDKTEFGLRVDGTPKGTGFFGLQKMTDGSNRDMTEFSIGIDFGQGEIEVPTLVPTLTKQELEFLKAGNDPSQAIMDKAISHAEQRISIGKSPFIEPGEKITSSGAPPGFKLVSPQEQPVAQKQKPTGPFTSALQTVAEPGLAIGGAVANILSSGVAQIGGGISGLAAGLTGLATGEDDPAALGEGVRQRVTEQLTIPAGQQGEALLAGAGQVAAAIAEPFARPAQILSEPVVSGIQGLESEVLERFGPEAATALKTLPVAAVEVIAARLGAGPIKRAGERVSKGMDQAVFNFQTPTKQRAAELLRAGSTDKDISGFKLVDEPSLPEGAPRPPPRVEADRLAREAERQGFDPGVIAPIKAGSPKDKVKFVQMTNIMEKAKNNKEFAADNRPSDVVGSSVMTRFNIVKKANRTSGKELNKVAEGLREKPIDINNATDNFAQGLDGFGVELIPDGKGGFKPNFQNSVLAPGDRGPIKEVIRQMNIRRGNVDALAAHNMKRAIDRNVTFGKTKTGLSTDAADLLKQFRRDIDTSLDTTYPEYNRVNTVFSETIEAINDFQDVAGRKLDLSGPRANKSVGTLMRGELSNIKSRGALTNAREGLERMAEKYEFFRGTDPRLIEGPPRDSVLTDSILKQIIYADELDRRFGTLATTGFEGGIEKASKSAARGSLREAAVEIGAEAAKKARGITDKAAFQSIRDLLK